MEAREQPQLSSPSGKKSRRAVQKRVLMVPVADVDGGRSKGGGDAAPPSDSWAWRKYGQKPIKGSPYPRGYYRCSSSKGCPARKQVERSRVDPATFIVTYSSDHDHGWPSLARTHRRHPLSPARAAGSPKRIEPENPASSAATLADASLTGLMADEPAGLLIPDSFGWFAQISSPSSNSPAAVSDAELFCGTVTGFHDCGKMTGAAVDEEEEALFAGLGELPESSVVLRRLSCSWA